MKLCCSDSHYKSILHVFLRYYKDIANLLFWVLWACHATQTQSDTINLWITFVFICRQKINFTLIFSRDIAKICRLILGTLDMPGCTHQKWYYKLVEDFNVYLHVKKNFTIHLFLRNILKNPAIWLADSIFARKSRTRILPDMELMVKYQQYWIPL